MDIQNIEQIILKSVNLPTIPNVVSKTMQLLSDPNVSSKDLQKVITSDSVMAAKILKISNSALYGCSREIKTISQAIVVLGFRTLRNIIVSASTAAMFKRKEQTFSLKDKILWEHSICCSIASQITAKKIKYPEPEEAFIGGLLHDIGIIVLDISLGNIYNNILKEAYNKGGSLLNLELDNLGYGHQQVGYVVIRNWNFAKSLQDAIRNHHHPDNESEDKTLTKIVSLANEI
ncbi:HDOD domain-containing protein, partial [bacterium]|nr:HDOD domain-containing protein [bacterium]